MFLKQSPIPVNFLIEPDYILWFTSWVYKRSFTLSMGATIVFETEAEIPPITKSARKFLLYLFFFMGLFNYISDILFL
jgi:hypothetical protein